MITKETAVKEGKQIKALLTKLPCNWDGKTAILEMKKQGYQWRQLEWIGFYGEMLAKKTLEGYLQIPGKRYGNVLFDAFLSLNWDIKVHPNNKSGAILNDCEAINMSIRQFDYHGLIILCVDCEYDNDGAFKVWHDALKGGMSVYEQERVNRGAPSRKRKTKAALTDIAVILLDKESLCRLGSAQKGWRNADGSPRREKYSISHSQIRELAISLK